MTNAENIGAPAAKAVKKKASGSSFYIAMRLMPEEERDAMFAIYAFCRKVDDIAEWLGISSGAVKRYLSDGLAKMAVALSDEPHPGTSASAMNTTDTQGAIHVHRI